MRPKLFIVSLFYLVIFTAPLLAQNLQIISIEPNVNQNYVNRSSNITITFDQIISSASLNDTTIIVRGNQSGKFNGSFSGGGTAIITFNPDNDFRPGEIVSVTLTTNTISEVGQSLSRGYTYSFTTENAATGMPSFTEHPVSGSSGSARDIKPLDYDRDGDLDILASFEGYSEPVYLFDNNGESNFCPLYNIGDFRNVEVYDVDGDGDYDSFGSNGNASQISWFENDGDPPPFDTRLVSGYDPWTLTGGDLDSDGDVDVLGAILNLFPLTHRLYWFANDGHGIFSTGDQISSSFEGGSDSYFYIRDINADGAMDILAFHMEGQNIVWYENNGSQQFSEHFIAHSAVRLRLASADMDEDGDIDITAVSTTSNPDTSISWFENTGGENFTRHVIPSTPLSRLYSVSIVDLDGDHDQDLLAGGYWYENDGDENFSEHVISEGLASGNSYYANGINYADLDEDGDIDILTLGLYSLSWHENGSIMDIVTNTPLNAAVNVSAGSDITITFDQPVDGSTVNNDYISVYSPHRGWLFGSFSGAGTNTITFNPDNDFLPGEMVEVSVRSGLLSAGGQTLARGYGFSFQVQSLLVSEPDFSEHYISSHTNNATGMDMADIDGDGDLDLISCSWFELFWHENDGSGNFTTIPITITDTPVAVFAFDQNGDGFMDIWVDNDGSTASFVYTNDGNQNFTEGPASGNLRLKQTMDINHDGDIDLLYMGRTNDVAGWLEASDCGGYGTFGSIPGLNNRHVQAGDMDNDGDTDFIAASQTGPVYYNNNGYFSYSATSFGDVYTTRVYLADLDFDGDLDPIFTEANTGIIWYENRLTEDSLDFSERKLIDSLDQNPQDVLAVDIDGDGDLDIAAISYGDDKVIWYANRLNEASADFGPQQGGTTLADRPVKIMSGDLDGDGDMDLVTLSEGDDELNWFENSGGVSAVAQGFTNRHLVFQLDQNYPNPFNPATIITYQLAENSKVTLKMYDSAGREIETLVDKTQRPGKHSISFDARGLSSGVYFYRLKAGTFEQSRKMILLR